jgi:hypothetical protein
MIAQLVGSSKCSMYVPQRADTKVSLLVGLQMVCCTVFWWETYLR